MRSHPHNMLRALALVGLAAVLLVAVFALRNRAGIIAAAYSEEGPQGFGGTDWVVWDDQAEGVVARRVHPLIQNSPIFGQSYIRPGDRLRQIDFQDVYKAEVATQIAAHAIPGTVLLYQVERGDPTGFGQEGKSLLIPVSFRPRFTFHDNHLLWALHPWMLMLGGFLALVTLLIVFPIIRPALWENWPVLVVATLSLGLFLLLGFHHLNLVVRTEFTKSGFERWFVYLILLAFPLYGCAALLSSLRGWWRLALLVPGLAVLGLAIWASPKVLGQSFQPWAALTEEAAYFLFAIQVFWLILLSSIQFWKARSTLDKAFHVVSLLYTGYLALGYGLALGGNAEWVGEVTDFLVNGAILIPLVSTAASQLKFGRVSLVLNASLQYVLFAAICILLFFVIEKSFSSLGVSFQYQVYLELSILVVLFILLRALWKAYEGRLRNYFILAQQERRDKIGAFAARIPQYTASRRLLDDLCAALKAYFETPFVALRLRGEESAGDRGELPDEVLEAVYQYLAPKDLYWARNRQVSLEPLPRELEVELEASPVALALPLRVNEEIYGMLLLGRKRRGVYNLDDMEILSRIIQQTRLTLGVLHLLEREKLLLEKNYEANLTALRSQINPHFLFNTLNTISALIHDDPDGAEKAVEKLAFIFRYTLKHSDKATVTLRDELSLVRTYLEIEQIRFGDRLNLSFETEPQVLDVELPAFVLQTIVENCIKHGTARITGKGQVAIKVGGEDGMVRCEIYDNGPGIDLGRIRASTGLSNILTRMAQIYGREDLLKFENTGNGTRVTVLVPMA